MKTTIICATACLMLLPILLLGAGVASAECTETTLTLEQVEQYRQEAVAAIMDYEGENPPPIPTEKVKAVFDAWKTQTFGPYEQELKDLGCNDEKRLSFCASTLYNYDNSSSLTAADENGDRFQNYLTRQDIIDYALGGECDDVFCDSNGKSSVWLVVADETIKDRVRDVFSSTIEWYCDNGAPDILESTSNNGVSVVFCGLVDPNGSAMSVYLGPSGTIWSNIGSNNISSVNDDGLREILIRNLFVESYGVAYLRIVDSLGIGEFNTIGGCELAKSVIAENVADSLEEFNTLYGKLNRRYAAAVEDLQRYGDGTIFGSPMSTRQLQLVFDVIDPIGFESFNEVDGMMEAAFPK